MELEAQMFNLAHSSLEVQCSNLLQMPHFCKSILLVGVFQENHSHCKPNKKNKFVVHLNKK